MRPPRAAALALVAVALLALGGAAPARGSAAGRRLARAVIVPDGDHTLVNTHRLRPVYTKHKTWTGVSNAIVTKTPSTLRELGGMFRRLDDHATGECGAESSGVACPAYSPLYFFTPEACEQFLCCWHAGKCYAKPSSAPHASLEKRERVLPETKPLPVTSSAYPQEEIGVHGPTGTPLLWRPGGDGRHATLMNALQGVDHYKVNYEPPGGTVPGAPLGGPGVGDTQQPETAGDHEPLTAAGLLGVDPHIATGEQGDPQGVGPPVHNDPWSHIAADNPETGVVSDHNEPVPAAAPDVSHTTTGDAVVVPPADATGPPPATGSSSNVW